MRSFLVRTFTLGAAASLVACADGDPARPSDSVTLTVQGVVTEMFAPGTAVPGARVRIEVPSPGSAAEASALTGADGAYALVVDVPRASCAGDGRLTGLVEVQALDFRTRASDENAVRFVCDAAAQDLDLDLYRTVFRDPQPVAGGLVPLALTVGGQHACAITTTGTWCWGEGGSGQLGDASLSTRHAGAPVSVVGGHTFVRIDAGLDHTCAVDQESVAWCWGDASGAVGVSGDPVLEPTRVSADLRFTDVSAGRSQSCGVTAEGDVYCWGIKGWLGAGGAYSVDASGPVRALLVEPVVQINSDFSHTCARTAAGVAYCWGFSYAGEVGADLDGGVTTPVRVVDDHAWAWVDGGHVLTCGLTTDGRGWCWGRGNFGRMGTGVEVGDVFAPTPVAGGHIFTAIDAGATHTCALDAEGQAWCWGYNDRGQLGIAAGDPGSDCSVFDCVHAPVAVDTDVRFTSVQPGDRLTCGVTTDQELVCWGLRERLGSGREIIEDEY